VQHRAMIAAVQIEQEADQPCHERGEIRATSSGSRPDSDVDKQDLKRYSDFINRKSTTSCFGLKPPRRLKAGLSIEPFDCRSPRASRKASTNSEEI